MGTEIYGVVEVKDTGGWRLSFTLDDMLLRDYDLLGELFGDGKHSLDFKNPLAYRRGLPTDCDADTRDKFYYDQEHLDAKDRERVTWCSYREFLSINKTPYLYRSAWHDINIFCRALIDDRISLDSSAPDWGNGKDEECVRIIVWFGD